MPRLSAIHDPILSELAHELRFASRGSALRQIERAEELAGILDPEQRYPREWVVFRITGYRPQHGDDSASPGASLLASLSAFVEQLCESAELSADDAPPGSLEIERLCARWGVSRKSIERARREGLVARRVEGAGARRLVFTPGAVRSYEARANPGPAPEGRRMPPELRAKIVRRAARYRRAFGWSANQSAVRLAGHFDYSAEAIRRLLKRHHERDGSKPVFEEKGPPNEREQRLAFRALRRGLLPGEVAERLGRDAGAVRRAALQHRVRLLRTLDLAGPVSPAFERDDAEEVILARPGVRDLLNEPIGRDLRAFLDACGSVPSPSRQIESNRAVALHLLRRRARVAIAALSAHPATSESVDAIETALRRASRLKHELVRGELGLLLATARRRLGVEPEQLPERRLAALIEKLFSSLCAAVDRFDPFHGGRLASPAGMALDRAALTWMRANPFEQPSDSRARRALAPVSAAVGIRTTDPWQAWLEPDPRAERVLEAIDESDARLLRQRFGLRGSWPSTVLEIAQRESMTAAHVVRWERRAIGRALEAARAGVG